MNWWKNLKGRVRFNEPLSKHTTFKIGGPARFFIEPKDTRDLKVLLILLKKYKIPSLVLGGGSNILASDKGYGGVVICLNSSYFKKIIIKKNYIEASAGCSLARILLESQKRGLRSGEFLAGIPGSLGGALVMNAGQGASGISIADIVENVLVMDYNGKSKSLSKKDIGFRYRFSGLGKCIVLSARLKFSAGDPLLVRKKMRYYRGLRCGQEYSFPSAGCVFKNPAKLPAGKLIDQCGLKGLQIGDARVSLRHANFIVNVGKARAQDVLRLMAKVVKKVQQKFRVDLEPEIKIWH